MSAEETSDHDEAQAWAEQRNPLESLAIIVEMPFHLFPLTPSQTDANVRSNSFSCFESENNSHNPMTQS